MITTLGALTFMIAFIMLAAGGMKASGNREQLMLFVAEFAYPIWFIKVTAGVEILAAVVLLYHLQAGSLLLAGLVGGAVYSHIVRQQAPAAALLPGCIGALLLWLNIASGTPVWELAAMAVSAAGGVGVCMSLGALPGARAPLAWKGPRGKTH